MKNNYTEVISPYCEENSTYVTKYAKPQEIKYNSKGEPYVTFKGTRLLLDMFMVDRNGDGKGHYGITYSSGYSIEILDNCEQAIVRYEYVGRSSKALKEYDDYIKERYEKYGY